MMSVSHSCDIVLPAHVYTRHRSNNSTPICVHVVVIVIVAAAPRRYSARWPRPARCPVRAVRRRRLRDTGSARVRTGLTVVICQPRRIAWVLLTRVVVAVAQRMGTHGRAIRSRSAARHTTRSRGVVAVASVLVHKRLASILAGVVRNEPWCRGRRRRCVSSMHRASTLTVAVAIAVAVAARAKPLSR
jgi:hypothetical protein